MTLPSQAQSAIEGAAEKPPARPKRRGLTIGHWLLIVIFTAVCFDIGIRIVSLRRASVAAAQSQASQRAIQQLLDDMRKSSEDSEKVLNDSRTTTRDLLEGLDRLRQNAPAPRDPSKGNIIPLEHRSQ